MKSIVNLITIFLIMQLVTRYKLLASNFYSDFVKKLH